MYLFDDKTYPWTDWQSQKTNSTNYKHTVFVCPYIKHTYIEILVILKSITHAIETL